MTDKERLLTILLELLKINGPSKKERPVADYLKGFFANLGITLREDSAGDKFGGDTGNLYGFMPGAEDCSPIAFLAHMDTVRPTKNIRVITSAREISTDQTAILGADDRAGIALICAMAEGLIKNKIKYPSIEIIFTPAEEIGLFGIKNIDYKKIQSVRAFVLDAGGHAGTIVSRSPGMESISLQIKGKSAHAGAEPEKGINAIAIAGKAISGIKQGRLDAETTCNLGKIQGGEAANIVPALVSIEGDVRSFNTKHLEKQVNLIQQVFQNAAKKGGGEIVFSHKQGFPAFDIKRDTDIVSLACRSAKKIGLNYNITHSGGGSDANIINGYGISSICLGIGSFDAHTEHEYILQDEFYTALNWVKEIIKEGCNTE